MRLFHGTDAEFEVFSLDFAQRDGMASNGHLGIWLAVDEEVGQGFGSTCLTVEADFTKVYSMPLVVLSRMHRKSDVDRDERVFYQDVRAQLVDAGYDAIAIVELSGRVDMYVALVPERLQIVARSYSLPSYELSVGR